MPNAETGARRVRESGHNYTCTGYGDKWIGGRRHPLNRHNRLHVAGGEGVHIGEDEVAVVVAAGSPAVGVLWDTCQRTTVGRKTSVCS